MLTKPDSAKQPRPELVDTSLFEGFLSLLGQENHNLMLNMLDCRKIGLSSMKMRDDLATVVGAVFNLEGFGVSESTRKIAAIRDFGAKSGSGEAAELIVKAAQDTRAAMSLLRLPVPYIALEFRNGTCLELKSYIKADRMNERIEDGALAADRPLSVEETMPLLEACFGAFESGHLQSAKSVTAAAIQSGGLLELIGIDCNRNNETDLKLYFSAACDTKLRGWFTPDSSRGLLSIILNACSLQHETDEMYEYIQSMTACGVPCSMIVIGFKGNGKLETKIYFDAWEPCESTKLKCSETSVKKAITNTYSRAGIQLSNKDVSDFMERLSSRSLVVDAIAFNLMGSQRSAKTYVMSPFDKGAGVRPSGMSVGADR